MDLRTDKAKHLTKNEVLILIKKYVNEQLELSRRKTLSEDNFTLPSWSEYQAYQLGMQKAFSKLNELLPDQGALSE